MYLLRLWNPPSVFNFGLEPRRCLVSGMSRGTSTQYPLLAVVMLSVFVVVASSSSILSSSSSFSFPRCWDLDEVSTFGERVPTGPPLPPFLHRSAASRTATRIFYASELGSSISLLSLYALPNIEWIRLLNQNLLHTVVAKEIFCSRPSSQR